MRLSAVKLGPVVPNRLAQQSHVRHLGQRLHSVYGIKDKGDAVHRLLCSTLPVDQIQMDMATGEVLIREQSQ